MDTTYFGSLFFKAVITSSMCSFPAEEVLVVLVASVSEGMMMEGGRKKLRGKDAKISTLSKALAQQS